MKTNKVGCPAHDRCPGQRRSTKRPTALLGCNPAMIALLACSLMVIGPGTAAARDYYVDQGSRGGACDDTNGGSLAAPWCTIARANATELMPGDTIFIREGNYEERIEPTESGTVDAVITYRGMAGEMPIVHGVVGNGPAARVVGVQYITFDGLIFDGRLQTQTGVYINNHGDHITIRNCIIRNFRTPENTGGHGVWLDRGGTSHVLIEDSQIHHNGPDDINVQNGMNIHAFANADHLTVRNCDIYESYTEDGLHLGAFGLVTDVLVENCRFWGNKEDGIDIKQVDRVTVRNCEFWGHRITPTGGGAGVVVHLGARDVLIDQCDTYDNDHGFAVSYNGDGSQRSVENITIQRSEIHDNIRMGIVTAGGSTHGPMEGMLRNVRILNNTIYNNDRGITWFAHPGGDIQGIVMLNNIFMGNDMIDVSFNDERTGVTSDYNDYVDGADVATISWLGMKTLSEFQSASGHGAHSLAVDARLRDVSGGDFTLEMGSPVVDHGTDVGLAFIGIAPDMGAREYDCGCGPGGICGGSGACVCESALTDCDGECVDTRADGEHCGDCTTSCSAGVSCVAGICRDEIVDGGSMDGGSMDGGGDVDAAVGAIDAGTGEEPPGTGGCFVTADGGGSHGLFCLVFLTLIVRRKRCTNGSPRSKI